MVEPTEVAAATACLQFWAIFGGACGTAFSTVVYTNVGGLDVSLQGYTDDASYKENLSRGLKASFWLWAGLCFFSKSECSAWARLSSGAEGATLVASVATVFLLHGSFERQDETVADEGEVASRIALSEKTKDYLGASHI